MYFALRFPLYNPKTVSVPKQPCYEELSLTGFVASGSLCTPLDERVQDKFRFLTAWF